MSSAKLAAEDFSFLGGGGEMGALMRAFDWSGAPLGPISSWPQSLKTSVSICLNSRFPMILWWGQELTILYNDPYIPALGHKHPHLALGQPGKKCWAEVWDIIEPLLDRVLRHGEANWAEDLRLFINRKGYLEECYFTFSYSPIRDETGGIAGVFTPVAETTAKVIGERRLRTLHELADAMNQMRAERDVFPAAASVLEQNPYDLPLAAIYSLSGDGKSADLRASCGIDPREPLAASSVSLEEPAPLSEAFTGGGPVAISDARTLVGLSPRRPWDVPVESVFVVPLSGGGQKSPMGFLVSGVNPRKPLDNDYRSFLELVAGQIASGMAAARTVEEERGRAQALQELDRAKTAFFSNISHEFRTPLTLMLGPLQQMIGQTDPAIEPYRQELDLVQRNARRLLKLVNNLLNFSRIEAGRARARYAPVDLAELTSELASVFRSAVEQAGLTFRIDCAPLGEPVFVDADLWEDVVLNLISNAFKFTFCGGINVRMRAAGGKARLSIEDTGVGISPADLPRLFERFHRIEGSRGRTHEGSGIGLALVRDIARLHGGDVSVKSVPGEGSVFTVTLPFGKSHLPQDCIVDSAPQPTGAAEAYLQEMLRWNPAVSGPPPDILAEGPAAGTGPLAPAAAPRARILLADDNADMRAYLRRLLGGHYEVEAVSDGAQAIAAIRRNPPALVVADVMMPNVDGFELLRWVRGNPDLRDTPVVLLSARAGEDSRVEGLNTGADDYLTKPFSARELLARVSSHLAISQVRREAAARERELRLRVETERRRWREIVEQAPAAMALLRGPDHVFEAVNPEYARATGRPAERLAGKPVREALPELAEQGHLSLLDQVFRTGQPYIGTGMPVLLDRRGTGVLEERFFTFVYQPFQGASNNVEGVLVHAVDVTGQVLAQRQIEEHAAELGAIMDAVPAALYIARDPACENITGNRTAYEIAGIPPGGNLSASARRDEPLKFVITRDGREIDPADLPVQRAARTGRPVRDCDLTYEFAGGAIKRMSGHAVPLLDAGGAPRGAVGSFIDVTESKRNEERLRAAQKLESVGLLAGGVAHDFNNLLVGILGNASLARDLTPPGELFTLLGDIEIAGQRAAALVRQMLVYAGKTEFVTEAVNLSALCQETTKLLQAAIPKHIELSLDLDHNMAPVEAGVGEMQQVVMNLVLNAAEAIGDAPGVVTVRTSLLRLDAAEAERLSTEYPLAPGLYVCLEVGDTGCGMDERTKARIFDPFFTTKFLGRGLGLAAVGGIIRSHKGTIHVTSAPGAGSSFRILMPVRAAQATEDSEPDQAASADQTDCSAAILIVDDEDIVLRAARAILERSGFKALIAKSGPEAIGLYKQKRDEIKAILLDVSMPGMSGPETLSGLRAIDPDVAVMIASGHPEEQARALFGKEPVSGFVPKPFGSKYLADALRRVVSAKRSL